MTRCFKHREIRCQVSHAVQLEADLTQVVERLRQDINLEANGEKKQLETIP